MQGIKMKIPMLHVLGMLLALGVSVGVAQTYAQATETKPISKNGLTEALKIGGLSQQEFIGLVKRRGVDFVPSSEMESELRAAGAGDDLIAAVRNNYRGAAQTAAASRADDPPPPAPPAPAPSGPARKRVTSLHEVRTIFIDKMANNLDQYLRAEISKKFNGSLTVVLDAAQADAILTSETGNDKDTTKATISLVDPGRTIVLWSAAAGDRKRLTLDISHGGEHTVAEHLIGQLKKATQSP
jgi:hypothetical protein